MKRMLGVAAVCLIAASTAAAAPFGLGEIQLGARLDALSPALDLRDIELALADAQRRKAGNPDLGRRGYGCMRRADPAADLTCVSHEERIDGIETREIRLHFLGGVLLQFSITAELRHQDALVRLFTRKFGAPLAGAAGGSAGPHYRWRNAESAIDLYGGENLVFGAFESAAYDEAVRLKRSRP